jgi:GxxExxY protein
MDENELSNRVIGAAIEVHKALGPGLLESAYQQCLVRELVLNSIGVETEVPICIEYKGTIVNDIYRMDLLVGGKLVVELKSVDTLLGIHKSQLLTYLRCADKKLGLLINFNALSLKQGIQRVVNNL